MTVSDESWFWKTGEKSGVPPASQNVSGWERIWESCLVQTESFNFHGIVNQEGSYKDSNTVTQEENFKWNLIWDVSDFLIEKTKGSEDLKKNC